MNEQNFSELISSINALGKIDWVTIIITLSSTLISAFVAYKIAKYQTNKSDKQFQEQIEENRKLEKELFFYKSRYESIGMSIKALNIIIEALKKNMSLSSNFPEIFRTEIKNGAKADTVIQKFFDQYINITELIIEYQSKFSSIIWESYFKNVEIVNMEREIKYISSDLYNLNNYVNSFNKMIVPGEYSKIYPALYGYVINELFILEQLLLGLQNINSQYFTDDGYEDAIIKTLADATNHNVSNLKSERDEWLKLLEENDIEGISKKNEMNSLFI